MTDDTAHRAFGRDFAVVHRAFGDGHIGIHRAVIWVVIAGGPAHKATHTSASGAGDGVIGQMAVDQFDFRHGIHIADECTDALRIGAVVDGHVIQRQILDHDTGGTGKTAGEQSVVQAGDGMAVALHRNDTGATITIHRNGRPGLALCQRDILVDDDLVVAGACIREGGQCRFQLLSRCNGNGGGYLFGILGSVIVSVAEAVALYGVLRSRHGDGDVLELLAHVIIAGSGIHRTGEGDQTGRCLIRTLGGQVTFLMDVKGSSIRRLIGKGDDLQQARVTLQTGNNDFVLQGQIALVDDLEGGQGVGAARLPQDGLLSTTVCGDPIQVRDGLSVLILNLDIQITGLDLVDTRACGVGEPCEGSAYQHSQAQNHSHDAAQQGPFGGLAICHDIFLLFSYV